MIRIPYVIDNQQRRMADVLNAILAEHSGKSLDIATAYFNVQGFRLLQRGLENLGSFRLLLGDEPEDGAALGLRPRSASRRTNTCASCACIILASWNAGSVRRLRRCRRSVFLRR